MTVLGTCDKVIVSPEKTRIINGAGDEKAIKARVKDLKSQLKVSEDDTVKNKYQKAFS